MISQILTKRAQALPQIGLLLCMLLTCLLAGCQTAPPVSQTHVRWDSTTVKLLKIGMKREEVHKLFGRPGFTDFSTKGYMGEDFTTGFDAPALALSKAPEGYIYLRNLSVSYDPSRARRVVGYDYDEGSIPYRLTRQGGFEAGKLGAADHFSEIKVNLTYYYELVDWFGEPTIIRRAFGTRVDYGWFFLHMPPGSDEIEGKALVVNLDANNFVTSFVFHEFKPK